jgi:hypothetical protein
MSLEDLELFAEKIQVWSPTTGLVAFLLGVPCDEHVRLAMPENGLPLWQNRDKVRFVIGVEAYPLDLQNKNHALLRVRALIDRLF